MAERIEDGRVLFLNQPVHPGTRSDAEVLRIADELEEFAPTALEADPAYLAFFATRVRALGRTPFRPRFIDTSYEYAATSHRNAIRAVFDVPVLDAYGSTECGFVFFECAAGRYHHNAEWSEVEITPLAAGQGLDDVGRLLVTPLRNPWLNLVRFDTGDLVRAHPGPCECGQDDALVLTAIEGRVKDLLVAGDGRFVTVRSIDAVLADLPGLLHWKLTQRAARDVLAELVALPGCTVDAAAASHALEARLGFAVRTLVVSSVPVEASGKFRLCTALHVDVLETLRGAS